VSGDESLEGVRAEGPATGARKEGITRVSSLLREPCLEDGNDISPQRGTPCLAALAEATNVGAGTQLDILATKPPYFAVAEAGLNGEEQDCPVSPSDPFPRGGSGQESGGLLFREELHGTAFVALGGNRQYALAVEGKSRFTQRDKPEEGADCGKTGVARSRAVAPVALEVVEELAEERRVEVFQAKIRGRPSVVL
jgi:hypothetical protein